MEKYLIVVDSNVIYNSYGKADFNIYDFNIGLKNIISILRELNIHDDVSIVIPEIIWLEIKQQRKEIMKKVYDQINDLKTKYNLPGVQINIDHFDYEDHSDNLLEETLSKYINDKYIKYNMPIDIEYYSIIKRAIKKQPPFEGLNKITDKGFKDAVLWESILKFKSLNDSYNIILYSSDNMFGNCLKEEYKNKFNQSIYIVKNEGELRKHLSWIVDDTNLKFIKDNEIYDEIRLSILNGNDIQQSYKYFMEVLEAYGPSLKVKSMQNINIITLLKSNKSEFTTKSDFYVELRIESILESDDGSLINFNPILYYGVNIVDNNIKFNIEGISGELGN